MMITNKGSVNKDQDDSKTVQSQISKSHKGNKDKKNPKKKKKKKNSKDDASSLISDVMSRAVMNARKAIADNLPRRSKRKTKNHNYNKVHKKGFGNKSLNPNHIGNELLNHFY